MFEVTPHHIWFISFHNTESWWLLMFSSLLVKRWCKLSYRLPINVYQLQSNRLNKCKTTKYFFNFAYPDVATVSDRASESYVVCFWQVLIRVSENSNKKHISIIAAFVCADQFLIKRIVLFCRCLNMGKTYHNSCRKWMGGLSSNFVCLLRRWTH